MKDIVLMGAGGFGAEAAWVLEDLNKNSHGAEEWNIIGYIDDDPAKKDSIFYGYKVLGTPQEAAEEVFGRNIWYYCAIGNNLTREEKAEMLDGYGWHAATLIHPSVIIARDVKIGEGTYIGAGSIICPNASIGRHVIVNTRVTVGHDSLLEEFSQASPGAQINGFCRVGRSANIGSNASLFPGVAVGEGATVGGNSLVVRYVKPRTSVVGVPAVVLRTDS
jgi:sugar O-acyltransferase (sialic acid O-acetyltransferase NeuD family)